LFFIYLSPYYSALDSPDVKLELKIVYCTILNYRLFQPLKCERTNVNIALFYSRLHTMEQTYTWLAPSEYSVFNYRVAGYSASVVHLHAGAAAVTSDGAHLAAI
jgi:hypothetical protein